MNPRRAKQDAKGGGSGGHPAAPKLMAIGAHADDIEFNAGGTLIKYRALGYETVYVMATNNMSGGWKRLRPDGGMETSLPAWRDIMPQRKREAADAAEGVFGTQPIHLDHPQRHYRDETGNPVELRYGCPRPDCVPPDTPSILTAHEDAASVKRLADLILAHRPEAVLTHGPVQRDMEHVGTCLLATRAFLQALEAGHTGWLLHWLDYSPSLFGPSFDRFDTHVDVSAAWEQKLDAIERHNCQIPDARGMLEFIPWGKTCGCRHAEVFTVGASCPPSVGASFSLEIRTRLRGRHGKLLYATA